PLPSKDALETETGYTGGKRRKKTWGELTKALDEYHAGPTATTLEKVRVASAAARKTFDVQKKRKKVGEAVAVKIQAALTRVETDCQIEALRLKIAPSLALQDITPKLDEIGYSLDMIDGLKARTVDSDGSLKAFIDSTRKTVVAAEKK